MSSISRISHSVAFAGLVACCIVGEAAAAARPAPPYLTTAYREALAHTTDCMRLGPLLAPTIKALHGTQTRWIVPGMASHPVSTTQRRDALAMATRILASCRVVPQAKVRLEDEPGVSESYLSLVRAFDGYTMATRSLGEAISACINPTITAGASLAGRLPVLDQDVSSAVHAYNIMRRQLRSFRLRWNLDA